MFVSTAILFHKFSPTRLHYFRSFVRIFEKPPRIYPALAVKNIEVNFIFLARLFVYLR